MRDAWTTRRRALLMFFLFVMFSALAVGYLLTFHLDTIRRVVQQQMVEAFGQNLQVGDIQVTFFPYPQLTLTELQILESQDGIPFFEAQQVQVNLGLLSVMRDEFIPKSLTVNDPKIYLRRNEKGVWNAESLLKNPEEGSAGVGSFFADYTLNIENGFIQVVDAFEKLEPETFAFNATTLQISNLSFMKPMDVFLSANLNDDPASQVMLQGTVSGAADLFSFDQRSEGSSDTRIELRTQLELSQSDLLKLTKILHVQEIPQIQHGRMKIQSEVRYAPALRGYELVLSDVIVLSDIVDLHGQASIDGLMTPTPPTISATWSNAPINIENILDIVPARFVPREFETALDQLPLTGKLEVVSATVSGSNREGMGFGLTGELRLLEGYADLGMTWGVAKDVEGTIVVQPDRIQIKSIKGTYDSIPVSSGMGDIMFQEDGPWFSAELQGLVQSKKLLEILRTVFDWNEPQHPMAKLVGKSGDGDMMIRFSGPLHQPERIVLESAKYTPEQATIQFPGIQGTISKISGTVMFSQHHVSFEPLKGMLGSSPVTVQGKIKFQDSEVFDTFKIAGRVSIKDLANQLENSSQIIQNMMSGNSNVAVTLSGPIGTPRIQGLWNLEGLTLNVDNVLQKKNGVKGTLHADMELKDPHRLDVHSFKLNLAPLKISGQASLDRELKGDLSVSLAMPTVDLSGLPPGLTLFGNSIQRGTIESSLNLNGKGDDWHQWNKGGWFALTKGMVKIDEVNEPVSNIFLRVRLNGHVADIKRLQFQMQDSQARVTGTIKNWDANPKVQFELLAPQFNMDLLVPKGERSSARDVLESIASKNIVEGTMKFGRAWYKDVKFQELQGRLLIKNGMIGVDRIAGRMGTGNIQGRFLVHLPVKQPATVKTWINVKDVPFQPLQTTFLSAENLSERLITGNLSLQGMVEGDGKDVRGILPTLNGDVKILLKDGRIRRGTVIPKMLALMNLPAVLQGKVDINKDGYPFDKQTGSIMIRNGIMTSKDIFMDGPILKLTAAGTYDLTNDQLNLAVAASPFGPYSKLLRKISLFRLLLEGDQESIGMAVFDVKGPIDDPVIKPLPLESFKSGLTGFAKLSFNVLKNTVTLPKNILFPKDSDSSLKEQEEDVPDF